MDSSAFKHGISFLLSRGGEVLRGGSSLGGVASRRNFPRGLASPCAGALKGKLFDHVPFDDEGLRKALSVITTL